MFVLSSFAFFLLWFDNDLHCFVWILSSFLFVYLLHIFGLIYIYHPIIYKCIFIYDFLSSGVFKKPCILLSLCLIFLTLYMCVHWASLTAQLVKNPPVMQETPVRFLGWEDPGRRDRLPTPVFLSFPCGSAGTESACNAGDLGLIPGLGKSPGEGKGYPFQYFGLENSMGCVVHGGHKELDTTEWLSLSLSCVCIWHYIFCHFCVYPLTTYCGYRWFYHFVF